ncbi:hypothetical protein FE88_29400 [Azospirillum brasilense]|nr:hypothetical protein AMK58_23335 [Azospirillum brasilense]OPH12036.1 hypothetical protein FE89_30400 [Azospirillum brasilense]OPH17843.1 hypothetical protein FE88_29400 [Azospirillum brasilense]PWC84879.1 hypothetical protein AEJ54_29120 [Azospirillum sp. Sp 7]
MDVEFCIVAVEKAMARYGWPDIFNTDQGSQFTSGQWGAFHFCVARHRADANELQTSWLIKGSKF